ncbi:MAG TPA: hypothetical protein VE907_19680 [Gammaproteobacteria bacterium]|nr:hypothetical protein [Gammaproteobacteria bacterium]
MSKPKGKVAGDGLVADVQRLRASIAKLKAERAELLQAPVTKGEALARIDAHLDYLAGEAAVNVTPFLTRGPPQPRDLIPPAQTRLVDGIATVGFDSVLRFLAWHNREALRAALVAGVNRYYETRSDGVDDETLAQRLAALEAELLELETDEELAIMALEAAGVRTVLRRADADPRALIATCD